MFKFTFPTGVIPSSSSSFTFYYICTTINLYICSLLMFHYCIVSFFCVYTYKIYDLRVFLIFQINIQTFKHGDVCVLIMVWQLNLIISDDGRPHKVAILFPLIFRLFCFFSSGVSSHISMRIIIINVCRNLSYVILNNIRPIHGK